MLGQGQQDDDLTPSDRFRTAARTITQTGLVPEHDGGVE